MVKIGVILNDEDKIRSIIDGTKVSVYQFIDSRWMIIDEVNICFEQKESIGQLRKLLNDLIANLKDCKVLIGLIFTGIPYMILDKEGFMLCETEDLSEALLTTVANDYEKEKQRILEKINSAYTFEYPRYPYSISEDGIYEFDMRKLQQAHPEISSKKVLIPFFKLTKFRRLDLYCSHVMPWFDFDLPSRGLRFNNERLGDESFKVTIEPIT
jgi:Fe-only nitrogenase accessory protein AnfO